MPDLIEVPLEISEKLHRYQYIAFEIMSLLYSFRLILRQDDSDEVLLSIWIGESENHLDNINNRIDRIQNQILEIHNAKYN